MFDWKNGMFPYDCLTKKQWFDKVAKGTAQGGLLPPISKPLLASGFILVWPKKYWNQLGALYPGVVAPKKK